MFQIIKDILILVKFSLNQHKPFKLDPILLSDNYKMSEVLTFKRDPVWLETLALSARTEIIFQGVSSSDQVTVPAVILVAISPLVNSILAAVHLDPSFFHPVISIPSVTENGLQMTKEMLVSGIASMSNPTINEVMEVFKILGIEGDLSVVRAENDFNANNSNGGDIVQRKTTGDPSNLNDIKPEHLISDDQTESEPGNFEIIIKLEEHTIENIKSAYQIENKTNQKQVSNQLLKDCKRLRINVAKLTNSSEVDINDQTNNQTIKHNVEKERCLDDSTYEVTKKKSRNKNSTCHICHKEYVSIGSLRNHINVFHMKK